MFHSLFRHNNQVNWVKVSKGGLRRWMRSKALYGTFSFSAARYREIVGQPDHVPTETIAHDAFPSFATKEDYQRIKHLLRHPTRRRRDPSHRQYPGARNFAFSRIYCVLEVPGRGPCGLKIGPQYHEDGTYAYRSMHCSISFDHRWAISPAVEPVVIEAVLSVLEPERIREAVDQVRIEGLTARSSVGVLRKRLAEKEQEEVSARKLAVKKLAEADASEGQIAINKQNEASRYEKLAEHAAVEAEHLREELTTTIADTRDIAQLAADDIADLVALARDLRSLLTEARAVDDLIDRRMVVADADERLRLEAHEGRVRAILDAAGILVEARPTNEGQIEIQIVFPGGGRVQRIVDGQYWRGSQVERLWLHHQIFVLERDANDVAAEIAALYRPDGFGPDAVWTPALVRAAALVHRDAEKIPEPVDPNWSLEQLGESTGEHFNTVLSAALRGRFGAGTVRDGTLHFELTDAAIEKALPEYGRRQVAQANGWPIDETESIAKWAQKRGIRNGNATEFARRYGTFAQDASGRGYCWSPWTPATDDDRIEIQLRQEDKSLQRLTRRYWKRLHLAAKEVGCSVMTLKNHAPIIPSKVRTKGRPVFVWLGPEVRAKFSRKSLEEAVAEKSAELGIPLNVMDFIPRNTALTMFKNRSLGYGTTTYQKGIDSGALLEVQAKHLNSIGLVYYVWLPPEIRNTTNRHVVKRWLNGDYLRAYLKGLSKENDLQPQQQDYATETSQES
jgi:hypothetical protein